MVKTMFFPYQSAFKNPAPTPSSSPVPQTSPSQPFVGAGLTETQQKMIESFMNDSRMNSEWSAKYVHCILHLTLVQ